MRLRMALIGATVAKLLSKNTEPETMRVAPGGEGLKRTKEMRAAIARDRKVARAMMMRKAEAKRQRKAKQRARTNAKRLHQQGRSHGR